MSALILTCLWTKFNVTDDRRIREALPTIKYILDQKAKKIILMSHLGRPEGQVVEDMRLKPIAKKLQELLKEKVLRLDDCIGDAVKRPSRRAPNGLFCWKTCGFIKLKPRMIPNSPKSLLHWRISTSMMLLARPTGPTPPPKA